MFTGDEQLFPGPFQAIGRPDTSRDNLPVWPLILVMFVSMLLKADFGALHPMHRPCRGVGTTVFVSGAAKPLPMALLAGISRASQ